MSNFRELKEFTKGRYVEPWSMNPSDIVRIKVILSLIGTDKKVLDIGCYDGTISAFIKGRGNEVYGIDISEKAIELAKQKGIKAQVGDVDNGLPFPDAFFDVVVAGEVIEHVLNIDFVIDEIKRVLKPHGFVIITTPNLASLGRRILLLLGKNPLIETRLTKESAGHVRYFVKDTLFELMKAHGLIIDLFCSDVVNFDNSGKHFSTKLARLFPSLGRSLIIRARKPTHQELANSRVLGKVSMKVAVISTYPPLHDGIAWATYYLANELSKYVDVVIIANKGAYLHGNVKVLHAWERGKLKSLFTVIRHCIKEKPNIVHIQFHPALYGKLFHSVFLITSIALLTKAPFTKKVVVEMHTVRILSMTKSYIKKVILRSYMTLIAYLFDAIIVHTNKMRDVLIQEYGLQPRKVFVVPLGLKLGKIMDSDKAKNVLGLNGRTVILNPSLLREGIGVEELIECLPKVITEIPNLLCAIVCVSPSAYSREYEISKKVQRLIKKYRLENNILLLNSDFFRREQLWINASDVLTFLHENYPSEDASLSILKDAIAYGKPVVVSDAPKFLEIVNILRGLGFSELVISNNLPKEDKIKCIANGILTALRCSRKDKGLIFAKFREFSKKRTWNYVAQNMLKVYDVK